MDNFKFEVPHRRCVPESKELKISPSLPETKFLNSTYNICRIHDVSSSICRWCRCIRRDKQVAYLPVETSLGIHPWYSSAYGKVASPDCKTPVKDSMGSIAGILHIRKKNVKQITDPTEYKNLSFKDSLNNEGSGECVAWLSNTPSVGIAGNSSGYEKGAAIVCKTPGEGSTGSGTGILHQEMEPNVTGSLHMTPSEGGKSSARGKGVPRADQTETNTEDMEEWDGYVFLSSTFRIRPREDSITGITVYDIKLDKKPIWTFFAEENVPSTLLNSITGNIFGSDGSGGNVLHSAQKKPLSNNFLKSAPKRPMDKSVGHRKPGKTPLSSSLCKAKCDDSINSAGSSTGVSHPHKKSWDNNYRNSGGEKNSAISLFGLKGGDSARSAGSRASASHPHKQPWNNNFRKSENKNSLCSIFSAENKNDSITGSDACVSSYRTKKAWKDLPGTIKGYKNVFPVAITSGQMGNQSAADSRNGNKPLNFAPEPVKNPHRADYSSDKFSAAIWSKTSQERRRAATKSTVFDAPGPFKPPPPRGPERNPIMMVGYTQRRAPRPPAERHFRNVITGEYVGVYVEKRHPYVHQYVPPKRRFPRRDNL